MGHDAGNATNDLLGLILVNPLQLFVLHTYALDHFAQEQLSAVLCVEQSVDWQGYQSFFLDVTKIV